VRGRYSVREDVSAVRVRPTVNLRTVAAPARGALRGLSVASITGQNPRRRLSMFYWAIVFLIIAIIAALFGFGGIAASAAGAAKIVFFVAIILAVISFLSGRRTPKA
jgi:uncharacterized membrane protein YtjA (UPF0391 family)